MVMYERAEVRPPHTRLHHLVEEWAERTPDAHAVSVGQADVTYETLWSEIKRVAAGLAEIGIQRGERVAVYLNKRIETVAAIFATTFVGAVFVPINPVLKPFQVQHILTDSGATALVTSRERLGSLAPVLADCPSLREVVVVGEVPSEMAVSSRVVVWSALGSSGTQIASPASVDSDVAAIFYTSGSTGRPKGVVISHRNLIVGAESVSQYLGNRSDDVILAVLPLSFDAGFSQLTTGFCVGAHVVMVDYLLPRDVARACARHRVTGMTCVPPLWWQLAEVDWPVEAATSVRYFASTGGRMPKATLDTLRNIFPKAKPYLMYGLTEAFRSTYLDPSQVDVRPDSIGKAIPNAEILVVRSDGSLCDADEPGELVHRGPLVSLGYWNDPDRTAVRFRSAPGRPAEVPTTELAVWSGDIVRRDVDGYLYFVGRDDEMIKTSGYRVSPTEVEEAAFATGLVGAAAAMGFDDDRLGQRIALFVTAKAETFEVDVLLAAMRKTLPLYMVPHHVLVRSELHRSPNGKIDRNRLRSELDE